MAEPEPEPGVEHADQLWAAGFTAVPNTLLADSSLSWGARFAFIELLRFSWQDGECFPGQDGLAESMGITPRQVRRYVRELEEAGLILVKQRGLGKTNVYVIQVPRPDRNVRSRPEAGVRSGPDTNGRSGPDTDVRSHVDEDAVEKDTEEEDSGEEEAVSGVVMPDTRVDQTSLLHEARPVGLAEVREKLHQVSKLHGAPRDTDTAIEAAIVGYQDKDAVAVADDLLFWATHGNGKRKKIKSVVGTYRSFLKRADESSGVPGKGKMSAHDEVRAIFNAMERGEIPIEEET